jgi:hypothetical protein
VVCSPCLCWWAHVLQPPPSTGARGLVLWGAAAAPLQHPFKAGGDLLCLAHGVWCMEGGLRQGSSPGALPSRQASNGKVLVMMEGCFCNTKWGVGGGLQEDGGSRTRRVTGCKELWAGVCRWAGHVFSWRVCESHCT